MKIWNKVLWINIGLFLGLVASIFIVPPETTVRSIVFVFVIVGGFMNYLVLKRRNQLQNSRSPRDRRQVNAIIALGLAVLVLDIVLTRSCRHS